MTARKTYAFGLGEGEFWALAAALGYASTNVLTRVVSTGGDPLAGSIIRTLPLMLISGIVMVSRPKGLHVLLPGKDQFLGWKGVWLLGLHAFILTPVGILAMYLAFRYGGVLVAVPVFSINPLWGALIAIPFLGEVFDRRIAVAMVGVLLGITLLTYGQHTGAPVSDQWPLGVLFGLLTALAWAVAANLNRFLLPRGLDVFWLQGISSLAATLVLCAVLAGMGRLGSLGEFSQSQIWKLVVAGALSGIASLMLSQGFRYASVARVTTLKTLDVPLASVVAVLLLNEDLNILVGLGILLMVSSVLTILVGKKVPVATPA